MLYRSPNRIKPTDDSLFQMMAKLFEILR